MENRIMWQIPRFVFSRIRDCCLSSEALLYIRDDGIDISFMRALVLKTSSERSVPFLCQKVIVWKIRAFGSPKHRYLIVAKWSLCWVSMCWRIFFSWMENASDVSSFIPLRSIAKKSLGFLVKVSSWDKCKHLVVKEIQLLEESRFGPHIVQPNGANTVEGFLRFILDKLQSLKCTFW